MIRLFGPRIAAIVAPIASNLARVGAQRLAIAIPTVGALILLPITFPIGFVARTVEESVRKENTEQNKLDDIPFSQRTLDRQEIPSTKKGSD